jgi:hypothetical protein
MEGVVLITLTCFSELLQWQGPPRVLNLRLLLLRSRSVEPPSNSIAIGKEELPGCTHGSSSGECEENLKRN